MSLHDTNLQNFLTQELIVYVNLFPHEESNLPPTQKCEWQNGPNPTMRISTRFVAL